MAIRAINSISKVILLASSIAYIEGSINDIYTYIAFGIGALGFIITSTIKSKTEKDIPIVHGRGSESLDANEELVSDFINSVLNYCGSKGHNVTLQTKPDGIWLSEVNDDTGEVFDLINLSLPDSGTLTPDSLSEMVKITCQQIDAKLAQLHN